MLVSERSESHSFSQILILEQILTIGKKEAGQLSGYNNLKLHAEAEGKQRNQEPK